MRLIDGDALIDEMRKAEEGSIVAAQIIQETDQYSAESIAATSFSVVIDVINEAPTIDPVKRGRWEHVEGYNNYYDDLYRCSLCGDEFVLDGGTPKDNDYNYCPNCGAKMIAEEG